MLSGDVQWATANFTLLGAIATLIAAAIAMVAIVVSYRLTRLAIQRSVDLAAAKWIFDAHMRLNENDRLIRTFSEVKWGTFNFSCAVDGDLNSPREHDLIYFLDFLNCVDAALEKGVISMQELNDTTIGFAIRIANRCEPITRYREFIARRDAELKIQVRAWGAISHGVGQQPGRGNHRL